MPPGPPAAARIRDHTEALALKFVRVSSEGLPKIA